MKITKTEKIWIALTVIFYVIYNMPGLPKYGDQVGAMVHGVILLAAMWLTVFIGTKMVYKIYPLKEEQKEDNK